MVRGTTPIHIFSTDIDLTEAEAVYITYKQNSSVVLEKTKEDIELGEGEIRCTLSQADTLQFKTAAAVRIQIRARFADGSAVASNIISTTVSEILKDGEI